MTSEVWESLKSILERIGSWWSALWADESTEQVGQAGDAQFGLGSQRAGVRDDAANDSARTRPDSFPARTETG